MSWQKSTMQFVRQKFQVIVNIPEAELAPASSQPAKRIK